MVNWNKKIGWDKYIFSLGEIRDLIFITFIIGFLFSATHEFFTYVSPASAIHNFFIASVSFLFVLIPYILVTKYFADRYNCNAEFALWPIGSIISIILTLLTQFVFAVVGAIQITTKHTTRLGYRFVGLTNEELGKIAIAGPVVNFLLALIGFAIYPLNPGIVSVFIMMNLIFAFFNLIPIPPLNGSKVFGWSRIVWAMFISSILILIFLPDFIGTAFSILIVVIMIIIIFLLSRLLSPWTPPTEIHKF